MTKEQYKRFLKLPEARKKTFISIAKREGMSKKDIYWLEFGYEVHKPAVRKALFESIYTEAK